MAARSLGGLLDGQTWRGLGASLKNQCQTLALRQHQFTATNVHVRSRTSDLGCRSYGKPSVPKFRVDLRDAQVDLRVSSQLESSQVDSRALKSTGGSLKSTRPGILELRTCRTAGDKARLGTRLRVPHLCWGRGGASCLQAGVAELSSAVCIDFFH